MLVLEWNNPRITTIDLDMWIRTYLGDIFDGLVIQDNKLYVMTHEVLNPEQEDCIRDYFYAVNNIPRVVTVDTPLDSSSRPLYRIATTNDGWVYSPRSLDFYTAKYKSLYNREHDGAGIDDGTDLGDALMKFFDQSGLELTKAENESDAEFQIRLDANCVKTFVDFEPTFDIDIYGCKLMIENTPSSRAYLWTIVAPDIPKAYGGCKEFMGGGMNLQMIQPKEIGYTDGKSSKTIRYDSVNHSGKIRIIIKHGVGEKIGLQMIYEFYRE